MSARIRSTSPAHPRPRPQHTERQRAADAALNALGLDQHLAPFGPVLAGTIPLGIDTPESDLDIICEVHDPNRFESILRSAFGGCEGFQVRHTVKNGLPTIIASFCAHGFAFEVFGQPRPAREQNAVRHMQVEARLLALAGETARREIQALKAAGLKTEPAFARYFGIPGDPYQALLALAGASEDELRRIIAR